MPINLKLRLFVTESLSFNNSKETLYVDRIKKEINICNAIYKKANIQFHYEIMNIISNNIIDDGEFCFFNKNLPQKFFFPILKDYQLSTVAQTILLNEQIACFQEKNIIKVYCFNKYFNKNNREEEVKGASIPSILTKIIRLKNSILLGNQRSEYTLAHEISHILLNAIHNDNYFVPENNIFSTPANKNTTYIFGEDYKDFIKKNPYSEIHPACKTNQLSLIQKNSIKLLQGLL